MIFQRKSIFDILNEAEDDDNSSTEDTSTDATENDSSSEDNSSEESDSSTDDNSDDSSDNDDGNNEDFSIDTDLDSSDDSDSGDNDGGDSTESSSDDLSSSDNDNSDEEPVQANTDIFNSLTAEEQKIKIEELKKMYGELYSSCNDLLEKINLIDSDDDILDTVTRISMTLYSLKQYISDYIITTFASKSYIENDVNFNRFLSILNSIANITDELADIRDEKLGKSEKK
nr:MAG TPA: hypothetical protein [Herelleviridae sp.]